MDAPALLIQAGKERRGAEGNGREEVGEETSSGRKEGQACGGVTGDSDKRKNCHEENR